MIARAAGNSAANQAAGAAAFAPTSAREVADFVRESATLRRTLRIAGAGSWLDAGRIVRADATLSLAGLDAIVEYRPEDLTLTCGAGTTLTALDGATREHGQWCPLLPWGDDTGTVGATIATATSGPFAERLGRPRNLVLGLECVDGTGRLVAAGARVVKNVAGFDLTRAMTGSWGTLAVITQLHLRLRARPAVDESWLVSPRDERELAVLASGPHAPLACARVSTRAGTRVGTRTRWLVRIGGNAGFVTASSGALRALGDAERLDDPAAQAAWARVRRDDAPVDRASRWRWDPLSARLKEKFDPTGILNPGLLGAFA